MNPQLVQYINDLTNRINSCADCRTLDVLEQEILASIGNLILQEEQKIAKLTGLSNVPTNLDQLLQWIENYIGLNFVIPLQNAIIELAQLTQAIIQLQVAINNKLSNLSCVLSPILQGMGAQQAGNIFIGGG